MSKAKSRSKPDDPKQSADFIKKAREIEADEERSRSDELLGKLARMKPEPRAKKATD